MVQARISLLVKMIVIVTLILVVKAFAAGETGVTLERVIPDKVLYSLNEEAKAKGRICLNALEYQV